MTGSVTLALARPAIEEPATAAIAPAILHPEHPLATSTPPTSPPRTPFLEPAQIRALATLAELPTGRVQGRVADGVLAVAPRTPQAACLMAARRAEEAHGLPPGLMVAIALSESGLHAHAMNIGGRAVFPEDAETARNILRAAHGRTVMAGCVQVNTAAHARNGETWPLDADRAADWGAALLRRFHDGGSDWTYALTRWHGGSPAGSRRVVCRVRAKLEVVAPGSQALSGSGCGEAEAARNRRNGRVHLEVAEAP